ncbi:nucleoside-diphosphate kinase [Patescibacteria group bacterium]|nr:nucleoside-diphosphate kinase [Patescibacteria group bacterium]
MLQQTLVLVKPDGVQRGLIGEIIKRFEQRGLKIIGLKLVKVEEDTAKKHYTEDISQRRGEKVRENLLKFISLGPVVAIAIEGVDAIENVRKLVGDTESKNALPGTIRGDFSHVSFNYAKEKGTVVKNVVHASSSLEEAKRELGIWFSLDEIHDYKRVEEEHIF